MTSTEVITQLEQPSKKWWKYLLWFFVNLSVVNAYILEKIAGTKKRRQLHFRLELAKQLIAGFNGYKRSSDSGKRAVRSVNVERLGQGHHLLKSKERKKACAMCSKVGRKRAEGRTCETTFVCEQCGVPLCRQIHGDMSCFDEWHSGNLQGKNLCVRYKFFWSFFHGRLRYVFKFSDLMTLTDA